jgi:hypothetical protein
MLLPSGRIKDRLAVCAEKDFHGGQGIAQHARKRYFPEKLAIRHVGSAPPEPFLWQVGNLDPAQFLPLAIPKLDEARRDFEKDALYKGVDAALLMQKAMARDAKPLQVLKGFIVEMA